MNSGILVVAAQRELRRSLFDALDQAGYPQIHSARDVSHAAILLEGRASLPPLQLIVAVLAGDEQQARACCEQLRRLPGGADTPLILVLAEEAKLAPTDLPPGITDWLSASQIGSELVPRWRRSQAGQRPRKVVAAADSGAHEDYRYVFEEGDSEWLIADAQTGRLLEVSPTVARHSRMHAGQWEGLPLSDVLRFEGIAISQVLAEANRSWYPCQRKSAQGADTGQASVRRIRHAGHEALALMFRSDRADLRAEAALSLLSRIFASTSGVDAQTASGRLLFDELGLDYLAVWSARQDGADAPTQMLQLWSGDDPQWPPAQLQSSLQLVLGGKPILYRNDAKRLAPIDPLLQQLDLAGFAGLPLYDERHTVLGAMLAGSRRGFGEMGIIEPVLRCAAARFAQMLELGRTREQGRAEGLVDALTGLPNRLLFNDRLDTIIREATRNGECFAVLFVDLDRFKAINDTLGHAAGDELLRQVAQRLSECLRKTDTLARLGGDEFVAIMPCVTEPPTMSVVARRILARLAEPFDLPGGSGRIAASIGIAFYPEDATDTGRLMRAADTAMYRAKEAGRNTFVFATPGRVIRAQHDTDC